MSTYHKRHSSDLKFCSCRMCRSGLHTKHGGFTAQYARRCYRRRTKVALRNGNYDLVSNRHSVDYTD